jgi:predicted phosphodiesterase
MRIAALYDIHGNLPALDAVLRDVRTLAAEIVVVGGDVVPGPMPIECLERLSAFELPVEFIRGNGELAVLAAMAGGDSGVPPAFREVIEWSAAQLGPQRDTLAAWPKTVVLDAGAAGRPLFCHATPRDENEIFTAVTPDDRVAPMFSGVDADVVVCGHTHMQFDRVVGATRVINAGSVGMPFGDPGAYWLLIEDDFQLRRTPYNFDGAAARVRATTYPQADAFADGHVLHPPSAEQMLAIFESVASR